MNIVQQEDSCMKPRALGLSVILLLTSFPLVATEERCKALQAVELPDTHITSVEWTPADRFVPDPPLPALALPVPAHCTVSGVISPSPASEIRFEVWLPVDQWNGKYQGVGNGGFAGRLNRADMAAAVQRGFATATTDTGHGLVGTEVWAKNQPEKIRDFGDRAIHLTTVAAKAIVGRYYGRAPARSYFASCSNGGRQALMEAQRHPEDFDGIIAGAPAYDWVGAIAGGFAWNAQALFGSSDTAITSAMTPAVANEVKAQCDLADGLNDGVIADPPRCDLQASKSRCPYGKEAGKETDESCLSARQWSALEAIYQGPHDSKRRPIYPGFSPGGEVGTFPGLGWEGWIFGDADKGTHQLFVLRGFMRDFVTGDPHWDFHQFDFDRDYPAVRDRWGPILNATDPDLTRFFARGGKLILWHGWSDAALPPLGTIRYLDAVLERMGPRARESVRLFMAPGVQHCVGGPGPYMFNPGPAKPDGRPESDMGKALEHWVEKDVAPEQIEAWRPRDLMSALSGDPDAEIERTGLLCAYPAIASWDGKGDPKSAASYQCKTGHQ